MARVLPIVFAGFALTGCLGSSGPEGLADEPVIAKAHRVQLQLEPGWQVAERSLTPKLLDPKELLSIGTLRMEPGGECAHLPSRSFDAMGAGDALITIQEREAGKPEDYPPRPKHFGFDPVVGTFACVPKDLRAQILVFSEVGRRFHTMVVVDRGAPIDEVEAILDSFEASPEPN